MKLLFLRIYLFKRKSAHYVNFYWLFLPSPQRHTVVKHPLHTPTNFRTETRFHHEHIECCAPQILCIVWYAKRTKRPHPSSIRVGLTIVYIQYLTLLLCIYSPSHHFERNAQYCIGLLDCSNERTLYTPCSRGK